MKTPIQKLFDILEQTETFTVNHLPYLIISKDIMSIKLDLLEEERELIKQAFYAGGQAYKFNTQWEKEAEEYIKKL